MKKYLSILVTMVALLCAPTSYAFHGAIRSTQTVQSCSSNCNPISTLTVGSVISLNAQMDILGYPYFFPNDVGATISTYTIQIISPSNPLTDILLLDSSNTSLISSGISTITGAFEQTTITGGTAVFDTTLAFSPYFGLLHSELTFNFDKNLTEFRVLNNLTATASELNVSAVPIPGSLVLLFSGVMLLTSVSRKRET